MSTIEATFPLHHATGIPTFSTAPNRSVTLAAFTSETSGLKTPSPCMIGLFNSGTGTQNPISLIASNTPQLAGGWTANGLNGVYDGRGNQVVTAYPVGAVCLNGKLIVSVTNGANHIDIYSSLDPLDATKWVYEGQCPTTINSSSGSSLATDGKTVFMLYRGLTTDSTIWLTNTDGSGLATNNWRAPSIQTNSDPSNGTPFTPAIAVMGSKLVIAYAGPGNPTTGLSQLLTSTQPQANMTSAWPAGNALVNSQTLSGPALTAFPAGDGTSTAVCVSYLDITGMVTAFVTIDGTNWFELRNPLYVGASRIQHPATLNSGPGSATSLDGTRPCISFPSALMALDSTSPLGWGFAEITPNIEFTTPG